MPDVVIRNARIWSPGGIAADADTAIVRDGIFAFVGRAEDVTVSANARIIDARGGRMLPGFTDAHAHLMGTGAAMRAVDLKGVRSVEDAVARVAERTAIEPAGGW